MRCAEPKDTNVDIVRYLLQQPTLERDALDATGANAIGMALAWGKNLMFEELLKPEHGVNSNWLSPTGFNAVTQCVKSNNLPALNQVLKILNLDLTGTADIPSPLRLAIQEDNLPAISALLQHPNMQLNTLHKGDTDLIYAISLGKKEATKLLVKHIKKRSAKADINTKRADGMTALAVAAQNNRVDEVANLLSVPGIDINSMCNKNWSPLHHAVAHGHHAVVQLLANKQADAFLCTTDGINALGLAASYGQLLALQILLTYRSDLLTGCDRQGRTALHHAVEKGNSDCLRALCAAGGKCDGFDVNAAAVNTLPVVMLAVVLGNTQALEILLACPTINPLQRITGLTALELAEERGEQEMVRLLTDWKPPVVLIAVEKNLNPSDSQDRLPSSPADGHDRSRRGSALLASAMASQGMRHTPTETKFSTAQIKQCAQLGYYLITTPGFQTALFAKVDSELIKELSAKKPEVWEACEKSLQDDLSYVGDSNRNGIRKLVHHGVDELRVHGANGVSDYRLLANSQAEKAELSVSGKKMSVMVVNFSMLATHENLPDKAAQVLKRGCRGSCVSF